MWPKALALAALREARACAQAQCCPEQLLTFFALLTGALLYLFLLLDSSINLSSI